MGRMYAVEGDPKEIVRSGYDSCSVRYNKSRTRDPSPELRALIEALPANAEVLDIGCGAGYPVTAALSHHASMTGVDISPLQIAEARKLLPDARFVVGDIASLDFDGASFDAIVSFYTLFHLPRDEHELLLERIARWLKPGGYLLMTVAQTAHSGYTERDFFGVTMFWSHFEPDWYVDVLESLDFEIVQRGVVGHGYHAEHNPPSEQHPFLFARASRKWTGRARCVG